MDAEAGTLNVAVGLPDGYHLTQGAPSGWRARVLTGGDGCVLSSDTGTLSDSAAEVAVGFEAREGWRGEVRIELRVYFCRESDVCLLDQWRLMCRSKRAGRAGAAGAT